MLAGVVVPGGILAGTDVAAAQELDRGYIDWEMRGFTYSSWWDDEYLQPRSDATMDRIRGTGANWVSLNVTQYMEYADSSSIAPQVGGNTASDAAIIEAINDAHARGMKVMLKPHIDVLREDVWRGEITPADKAAWFDSYRVFINHYAALSQQYGVEVFVVGSELASMSGSSNYSQWERTVSEVRARYSGKLTYSASLNEYGYASMWGLVDYLGFNFYFPLSELQDPTVEQLAAGWSNYNGRYSPANWLQRIRTWQAYWNKPVIFTEIGYRSILGTAISPWDYWTPGVYSGQAQARAYEAAFRVLANEPYVIGAFWWNWTARDIYDNPVNTEYSIAGKPAEAVVTDWYTNRSSAAPRVEMALSNVVWESYENYRERRLSVFFNVNNVGGGAAHDVQVSVSGASSNVVPVSPTESVLGDIAAGSSMLYKVVYLVPQGTSSFRVNNFASCRDANGTRFYFPITPPGY
ncbi:MAG: glycoside hydrolase family 113 [Thermoleophilia bacterium]